MAASIFQEVVNAVTARVTTAMGGTFPSTAVYSRRKPVGLEGDRVPCVIVCPGTEGARIIFETFGGNVVYGYPVNVFLISPANEIATLAHPADFGEEADRETFEHSEAQEVLRNAVYKTTLDGVDSVFNGEITTGDPVMIGGQSQALYMGSVVRVVHWSLETQEW